MLFLFAWEGVKITLHEKKATLKNGRLKAEARNPLVE